MSLRHLEQAIVFKQPWAADVVQGKLLYIARTFNTKVRGRVGILASRLDKESDMLLSNDELDYGKVIGSVDLVDTIEVTCDDLKSKMTELGGKRYMKNYSAQFLPDTKRDKMYIWVFKDPVYWRAKDVMGNHGRQWAKIDIRE